MASLPSLEGFARDETGRLTPQGQAERWTHEFHTARARLEKWHKQGEKIIDRYLDERDTASSGESRLNLFSANVDTQHAMVYGKIPGTDVTRRHDDSGDDVARVAALIWERVLEATGDDSYSIALGHALQDRLLSGLGFASARYEVETEQVTDPLTGEALTDEEGQPVEEKTHESVEVDYHYWRDVLMSPCRTHESARWYAWRVLMTREDLDRRFGAAAKFVPLNAEVGKRDDPDAARADPWSRAQVWEIWSKEDRRVYWYVEGCAQVLDERDDPLGLDGFWPFPRPLVARPTTRDFVPRPDFLLAQDLYNEIDNLSTRIKLLEDAVRVAGVYDQSMPEIARMLSESAGNRLYPAQGWASLAEKGGLANSISWLPLDQIVGAVKVLSEKRMEKIGLLQQVTGWSDIMRGQSNASETLGAQQLKAQYGSVRIAKFQAEFSEFASGLQRVRAEIIAKHFDARTILAESNVMATPDARLADQAVALIKSDVSRFRIEVRPENVNLTDYAQQKQERSEVVQTLGGLFSAMAPLIQMGGPPAAEFALATASWLLAGSRGGDTLEAEFDQFRAQLKAAAQAPKPPPQPDPKEQAAGAKAQADAMMARAKLQQTVVGGQIDLAKSRMDLQSTTMEHQMKMREMMARAALPQQEEVPQ